MSCYINIFGLFYYFQYFVFECYTPLTHLLEKTITLSVSTMYLRFQLNLVPRRHFITVLVLFSDAVGSKCMSVVGKIYAPGPTAKTM
jgi:hypothetical protein